MYIPCCNIAHLPGSSLQQKKTKTTKESKKEKKEKKEDSSKGKGKGKGKAKKWHCLQDCLPSHGPLTKTKETGFGLSRDSSDLHHWSPNTTIILFFNSSLSLLNKRRALAALSPAIMSKFFSFSPGTVDVNNVTMTEKTFCITVCAGYLFLVNWRFTQ